MAKTLAEIGFSIRDQVKGFMSSDDERIDIELVYGIIFNLRSLLIKEEYKTKGYIDVNAFSSTCCLEIECDYVSCNGINSNIKEYFVTLPRLEGSLGYDSIRYFGGPDKKSPYNKTSLEGFIYSGFGKFVKRAPTFTIVENIALLKNLPTPTAKFICVVGVFENPKDYCKEDEIFPIPGYLTHKLEMLAIQQLMSVLNVNADERNNARDDSPQGVNPTGVPRQ